MIAVGACSRPKPGESVCGDSFVICHGENEIVVAVADGLGHGFEAAEASQMACEFVRANSHKEVDLIIEECSKVISSSRGAAMSVVKIHSDSETLCYSAVGNVELRALSRSPINTVNYPGIVGKKIRRLSRSSHKLHKGDVFVLFTDGISSRLDIEEYKNMDPQSMADRIVAEQGKHHDDATCLTLRF